MPIKDRSKYPSNWKQITAFQRLRAGDKCELCGAAQGKAHPVTGSKVVLTVHHIERGIGAEEHEYPNLIVLCQRCHLRLDLRKHISNAKATRAAARKEAQP